jgi:protein-disulfide isomerase
MKTSHGLLALASLMSFACSGGQANAAAQKSPQAVAPAASAGASPVVAEVDGAPITLANLDEKVGAEQLADVRQREYDLRKEALDQLLGEKLFAKEAAARKLSVEELLKREVDDKLAAPDKASVEQLYEQNKARFASVPKEQALSTIEGALRSRERGPRLAAYRRELMRKAAVRVSLEPPRSEVRFPAEAPALGPAAARVTIVEYADFQCPYCARAQEVVDQVMKRYEGKVRLVHRDFPLDFHPRAQAASKAALCAGVQGRFWDYHRTLLKSPGDLGEQDLKKRATDLRLDLARFDACMASPEGDNAIQQARREGSALGVTGTPTFFVNGRRLVGARPFEDFVEIIDDELERAR